jgi:hypothetical protein
LSVHRTPVDRHVAPLDKACFGEALMERRKVGIDKRSSLENAHHRHRLLRARRERPYRCAAEQRDELASFHSIT